MKKLLLVMLLVVSVLVLAACGGGNTDSSDATNTEPVVLKISHVETDQDTLQVASKDFETYVEEKTNGSIDVQVYPNAELGNDVESVEGLLVGTVEMAMPAAAQITNYQKSFGVLDMPFIFKDTETAFAAVDGELGERLIADAKASGLHVLGFYFNGNRSVTTNVKPINTPADMKGLDIRVMESPIFISMMESLGANPTPMAYSEVYTALQQGAVDAEENGPGNVYTSKFHEVQKYYSLTNHTISIGVVTMGETFFQSLTADQQAVITEAARLYLVDEQRQLKIDGEDVYLQKMKDYGVAVNEITPENHLLFVEAVKPVYDQFREEIGQDIFDLVDKYNNQ